MRSVLDSTLKSFKQIVGRKSTFKRSTLKSRPVASLSAPNHYPLLNFGPSGVFLGVTRLNTREYSQTSAEKRREEEMDVPPLNSDFCELFDYASSLGPCFPVDPNCVEILKEPSAFYDSLLVGIRKAKHRIVISSLYLGAEPLAVALVEELDKALEENETLQVEILLDCLRGSRNVLGSKTEHLILKESDFVVNPADHGVRKGPGRGKNNSQDVALTASSSTDSPSISDRLGSDEMNARGDAGIGVKEKGKRKFGYYETVSSVSMLFPLQWKYGERVKVSYYHTPKLHGMWKTVLPERVNELVGVQHSKFYLFDNDILISGANLSEQYFTNRQDRYIWIRQNPAVAQFYHSFLKTVSRFSFSLHPESGILAFPEDMPDPSKNPSLFNQTAKNAFSDLLASHLPPHPHLPAPHHFKESSTWVFPTIQLGHAGVRHDEALTLKFLSHVPSSLKQPQNQLTSNKRPIGTIVLQNGEAETAMPFASPLPAPYATHLTSPYFNITDSYNQAILSTKKPLSVIVASPKANGFHGASGLSSYIPWAYDSLLKDWITSLDVDRQVEVREWAKEGWTFHAKGIWIDSSPIHPLNSDSSSSIDGPSSSQISSLSLESLKVSNQETNSDPFKRPSSSSSSPNPAQIPQTSSISEQTISSPRFAITMVGSSNFGTRSTERDLESQLAIFTIDESLSDRLKQEREWIWGQGEAVSNETFNLRSHNHSPLLRILMPFATKYM